MSRRPCTPPLESAPGPPPEWYPVTETFFRRPLIPCLLAYVAGTWLAFGPGIAQGMAWAWLAAVAAVACAGGWALWKRDFTPLALAGCMALGVAMSAGPVEDRRAGQAAAAGLAGPLPRVVRGTVTDSEFVDGARRVRMTLRDVTATSGTGRVSLPGLVAVTGPAVDGAATAAAGRPGRSSRARDELRRIDDPDEPADIAASTESGRPPRFAPGDRIRMLALVGPPEGFWNFHQPDPRERMALAGIHAVARVTDASLMERVPAGETDDGTDPATGWLSAPGRAMSGLRDAVRSKLAEAHDSAREALYDNMAPTQARLMDVMLFNEMRLLSEEDGRVFRDSGTLHLFAVSGTHIALLAWLGFIVLRVFRLPVRTAWTLMLVFLAAYVAILDFNPPAFRALLMAGAFVAGLWLRREVDPLSALAFGCAVILLFDPAVAFQAGFQLSVAGVVAILVVHGTALEMLPDRMRHPAKRLDRWAAFAVSVIVLTVSVAVVVMPLQLWFFQQFNIMSLAANVVEAALASLVLAAGMTVVVSDVVAPPLAPLIGAGASVLMAASRAVAAAGADMTWAIIRVPRPPAVVVFAYFVVLFSGYYVVRRHTPEWRPKALARLLIHGAAALALLVAAAGYARLAPRPLRIWFLDVGQGDSTLVQLPDGRSLLIDAGHIVPNMGRLVVGPELRAMGIRPLDELVATHADADHVGGIPWLLRNHGVRRLVEGTNHPANDSLMQAIDREAAFGKTARTRTATADAAGTPTVMTLAPGTTLEVLNPLPGMTGGSGTGMSSEAVTGTKNNDQSVVLRLRHGKFSALLMADAETAVEARLAVAGIAPCDVLKAGHHGSRTSTTDAFLAAVRPAAAVISCGRANTYGHPHPTVTARLTAAGVRIFRTDRHGAVMVETDGEAFTVETVRDDSGRR